MHLDTLGAILSVGCLKVRNIFYYSLLSHLMHLNIVGWWIMISFLPRNCLHPVLFAHSVKRWPLQPSSKTKNVETGVHQKPTWSCCWCERWLYRGPIWWYIHPGSHCEQAGQGLLKNSSISMWTTVWEYFCPSVSVWPLQFYLSLLLWLYMYIALYRLQ